MEKLLFVLLLVFSLMAFGQRPTEGQLSKEIDDAVALMESGQYDAADIAFRLVIGKMETLPSNLAYYFGRNSFHLEKHKQSINWLNKYIQLKGTKGRFYDDAVKYLQLAEEEYLIISRQNQQQMETELSSGEYDCGGLSKMICPVCHGNGVVIKRGPFDLIYQTCPYSAGESFLTCEEYNLFMKGLLAPKIGN
jgi:hypothetical protein